MTGRKAVSMTRESIQLFVRFLSSLGKPLSSRRNGKMSRTIFGCSVARPCIKCCLAHTEPLRALQPAQADKIQGFKKNLRNFKSLISRQRIPALPVDERRVILTISATGQLLCTASG